jgi:hypothetical protein
MDGQEICAAAARDFFERLREGEAMPPGDLGRYLDLLHSRGVIALGVDLDVGPPTAEIGDRCQRAIASMVSHGWIRVSELNALHDATSQRDCGC